MKKKRDFQNMVEKRSDKELSIAEIGKKDLFYFNKHILKYKDVTKEVHGEWQEFKEHSKKKMKLILVPREHFKSSYFTIGETLQDIVKNQSIRILIANATLGNALSFLREIKEHIERNETLHKYFPETASWQERSSKWSEKQIILPRERVGKEPTIEATGVGGNLVSQHYDKIVLDDLVNRENVATRLQADKVIDYFKYCLSLLESDGEILIIGTRWSYFELYQYILDELKNDFDIFIRNCWRNESQTIPYFPEKFTKEHLDKLKRIQGNYIFSCQYENNPVDIDKAVFKKSSFRYYQKAPELLTITTTIDPNFSERRTADFGVILTLGQDLKGNLYILDIIRKQMNPYVLINRIIFTFFKWKPEVIGVEANALQKTLQYFINEVLTNRNLHLPIRPIKVNTQISKEMRILALQPLFEQGKIFLPLNHPELKYLEDELIKFPLAKTDDIVDALASQLQFTYKPSVPKDLSPDIPVTLQEKAFEEQKVLRGYKPRKQGFIDDVLGEDW